MTNESNEGDVPCLVCLKPVTYLNSSHLSSSKCNPGEPQDIQQYREWVARKFGIPSDDPIFEPNQIQKPQHYRKHAERLDLPTI